MFTLVSPPMLAAAIICRAADAAIFRRLLLCFRYFTPLADGYAATRHCRRYASRRADSAALRAARGDAFDTPLMLLPSCCR
jgi:hypothetical protein